MPIFLFQKEKGSKPYPNVKFRTYYLKNTQKSEQNLVILYKVDKKYF